MPRSYPDRPYVGVGIVVFRGDEVLLAERNRRWSIPGGAQELGETVEEAGRRELLEETGLEVDIIGLIDVVDSINRDDDGRVKFHYTLVDLAAEWRSGEAVAASDVPAVKWVKFTDIDNHGIRDITVRVIRQAAEMRRR